MDKDIHRFRNLFIWLGATNIHDVGINYKHAKEGHVDSLGQVMRAKFLFELQVILLLPVVVINLEATIIVELGANLLWYFQGNLNRRNITLQRSNLPPGREQSTNRFCGGTVFYDQVQFGNPYCIHGRHCL